LSGTQAAASPSTAASSLGKTVGGLVGGLSTGGLSGVGTLLNLFA
jgi:predicted lipid-binding transport protein (Tim44 family)